MRENNKDGVMASESNRPNQRFLDLNSQRSKLFYLNPTDLAEVLKKIMSLPRTGHFRNMTDLLERDAGFCSGGDEDDMEVEDGIHSPTDASEDSVDVKVQAISLRNRNKRKCAEPRKLDTELPAKKRKIDLSITKSEVEQSNQSPFRPWSASPPVAKDESSVLCSVSNRISLPLRSDIGAQTERRPNEFSVISIPKLPSPTQQPPFGAVHPQDLRKLYPLHLPTYSPHHQEEPLSLVSKRKDSDSGDSGKGSVQFGPVGASPRKHFFSGVPVASCADLSHSNVQPVVRVSDRRCQITNKVKFGPVNKTNGDKKSKVDVVVPKPEDGPHQCDNKFRIDSLLSSAKTEGSSGASTSKSSQGGQQRNYKNMTRERRIEANARERTRVHTISAAFDTLRHSIPAYSHNQKLSKLSVLRIACSYILALSRLAGHDYSKDQSEPDLSQCVDNVSKTIQTEGKIRKKKED